MEDYKRGDDIRSMNEILSEKLRWTFQVDKLGDIVNRSASESLRFKLETNHEQNFLEYQFSQSASTKVGSVTAPEAQKEGNSVFIPAKEVLSLFSVILKSREIDKSFGFDDTYYDLVKALRIAPSKGKNYKVFSEARKELKRLSMVKSIMMTTAESGTIKMKPIKDFPLAPHQKASKKSLLWIVYWPMGM